MWPLYVHSSVIKVTHCSTGPQINLSTGIPCCEQPTGRKSATFGTFYVVRGMAVERGRASAVDLMIFAIDHSFKSTKTFYRLYSKCWNCMHSAG